MATIKFYIQSKKSPAGIYVRFRDGRAIDAKSKTKFVINPSDWSSSKERPKNLKDEGFKKLNSDLTQFKSELLNHYNKSVNNSVIDSSWLKDFINPSMKQGDIPTKLVDYFDYYALSRKDIIKPETFTKINTNKLFIEKFELYKKTEFFIKDVNLLFIKEFKEFCNQHNLAQNTFARKVRYIKTICLHARKNGIETHFQLDSIKSKNEKIPIIFLTETEYSNVCKKEYEFEYLNNVRDWLIVCCETAQRVSDFMQFTKDQIRFDGEDSFIEFTQIKTGTKMSVFVTPKLSNLLDKNGGNFPRKISAAKFNKYVKVLCKEGGLTSLVDGALKNKETKIREVGKFPKWQLISSKVGRKTYASNYFGKLPNELIMSQTGHKTESSFLLYVGKTQTSMSKQLATAFKNLKNE
ncbi:phage integrase SAM-like domain-containing protein [Psychroserpens mesophilus]|uniref:phage integrase SAM-like domain-containing protein n=1 Tax=Psychroserpens mesophilus TaxID=325473 RepID=UPI00058F1C49|nr:phage integrase SAM-like domain-containing protein [Psychroserpens mesophilus]